MFSSVFFCSLGMHVVQSDRGPTFRVATGDLQNLRERIGREKRALLGCCDGPTHLLCSTSTIVVVICWPGREHGAVNRQKSSRRAASKREPSSRKHQSCRILHRST